MSIQARFKFIAHALDGDGPFRPVVSDNGAGAVVVSGGSYLVRYPRESDLKFARRNELAWYASPLMEVAARFVGYIAARPPVRDLPHELYEAMAGDVDGKANSIDVFWQQFMVHAKARGSMLLLVDMPPAVAPNMAAQIQARSAPYWTMIAPELLTDYEVGDDGKFNFAEFSGNFTKQDRKRVPCTWRFDRDGWQAFDKEKKVLDAGDHPLGECPLLIFTEGADFPCFGPFAAIADLSKRLFNLWSELDEILRAQTFSLLTMQVNENSTDQDKIKAAQIAGETIGSSNLMVHSGNTPAFIAPPDGPARVYLDTITKVEAKIEAIGLDVRGSNAQESGISLQMRFQALNTALGSFAGRMEDLERRAWELSRRWLGMTQAPGTEWKRDYNMADIEKEMGVLQQMQAAAMPPHVIAQQEKRVVSLQFAGLEQADQDKINAAIDERTKEVEPQP